MAEPTKGSAGRVLLVEDETLVALHIEELLRESGFDVIGPVGRVADAVRSAEQEQDVAFAILDVNLSGDMSWPVARVLHHRGIPFVFASGYARAHAQVPADLANAPILSKPLVREELGSAIKQLMGSRFAAEN
jgi:CheY-like chemotaxis protein